MSRGQKRSEDIRQIILPASPGRRRKQEDQSDVEVDQNLSSATFFTLARDHELSHMHKMRQGAVVFLEKVAFIDGELVKTGERHHAPPRPGRVRRK